MVALTIAMGFAAYRQCRWAGTMSFRRQENAHDV